MKYKKIAVLGGGGRTGKYLVNQLINKGFQQKALLRHPEQFFIQSQQIEIVKGDATHPESIHQLVEGCEAIISVVGQRPGEPLVACRTTQNLLDAMNHFGIKRLILLAGLNVDTPSDQKGQETLMATEWMKANFPEIHADRQKSYALLEQSLLDWTLVRIPFIEFQEACGEIAVNLKDCPSGKINAESLAVFLVDQLLDESYYRKAPFVASV
ncbi:MAG TPA: NAD(P)H-binding protein [Prolixibacteraceae bacterium]|nr:NAD(P)H-binding protein [Prolixibacteraceae bacterium]